MARASGRPASVAVGAAVVSCFGAAVIVLAATGTHEIRWSADHDRTVSVWSIWIPVGAAMLVARLLPRRPTASPPAPVADRPVRDARRCVAIAVSFAAAMGVVRVGGLPDGVGVVAKITLLAVVPAIVLAQPAWWPSAAQGRNSLRAWRWVGPVAAAATWFALAWVGPFRRDSTADADLVSLAGGFALNAYLEERFYRGWLQTRLEAAVGRWTAIGAASLLWAGWHVTIHGTGRPLVDAASVVAHLGPLGLLLGYLWARFRNPWPILAIHAAVNAPIDLVATAFT